MTTHSNLGFRRRLCEDAALLGPSTTDLQRAKIIERRNTLQRKIDGWISIQQLYMPQLLAYRKHWVDTHSDVVHAEQIPLFLPSAISSDIQCSKKALEYEWRLRKAQAYDALESLRNRLCLRTHMYKFKDRFVTGQRQNTRARSTINYVEAKIQADAERYRSAYSALTVLGPLLGEESSIDDLKTLSHEDIQGASQGVEGSSEGTRRLSWIWMINGVGLDSDEGMQKGILAIISDYMLTTCILALHLEWCRSRARAHRWSEECRLLLEEMRRILAFYNWEIDWWKGQIGQITDAVEVECEGLTAYALRQASIRKRMQNACIDAWTDAISNFRDSNSTLSSPLSLFDGLLSLD